MWIVCKKNSWIFLYSSISSWLTTPGFGIHVCLLFQLPYFCFSCMWGMAWLHQIWTPLIKSFSIAALSKYYADFGGCIQWFGALSLTFTRNTLSSKNMVSHRHIPRYVHQQLLCIVQCTTTWWGWNFKLLIYLSNHSLGYIYYMSFAIVPMYFHNKQGMGGGDGQRKY